jgi:hypothetical protein
MFRPWDWRRKEKAVVESTRLEDHPGYQKVHLQRHESAAARREWVLVAALGAIRFADDQHLAFDTREPSPTPTAPAAGLKRSLHQAYKAKCGYPATHLNFETSTA